MVFGIQLNTIYQCKLWNDSIYLTNALPQLIFILVKEILGNILLRFFRNMALVTCTMTVTFSRENLILYCQDDHLIECFHNDL